MASIAVHELFRLRTIDELRAAIAELGLDMAVQEDVSCLALPVQVAGRVVPNSMAIQPMEGCDGTYEGAPDELTFRRYRRFGEGGAGLLWFEACAVVPEGRANPRQFRLNEATKKAFAGLLETALEAAAESMGSNHRPFTVLQLTHSGRYSRPEGAAVPVIAHHDAYLDSQKGIPPDHPLVSDGYLEALEDRYVEAARLAFEVGFDAIDIKACHGYLVNELLAAHTRLGNYGGSYENRTRFLKNVIAKIYAELGQDRVVTCRLGVYDAHPYPYGWGMDKGDPNLADLAEPKRLALELREMGFSLINITGGNPYVNAHVNRPYDRPTEGMKAPSEHPLAGVARLVGMMKEIQRAVPDIVVVGGGYSWLRNLWPHVAAANIRNGAMRIVGLGRQAFAFPAFAKEIIETGKLELRHTCITCSSCTQIMRDCGKTGCVPFDREVYGPIYREGRRDAEDYIRAQASRCRDCFDPQCKDGCPAGVDIPGFIAAMADGDLKRSYETLRARNVLPEICAYVCAPDVQCEGSCVENVFSGNPVPIRDIQRYVARAARRQGLVKLSCGAPTGKRVAVIGAGPAGLACAAVLMQAGHKVEVFDAHDSLGGLAASVIPSRRIQTTDFVEEVTAVFGETCEKAFVFHAGEALSEEANLDNFASRFDGVFLGMGLPDSPSLMDSRPEGVEDAIAFLRRAKSRGARVPDRVAVLGGGNTAMDAACTAAACGAGDVYVVYRRSFKEMPAWRSERAEAVNMGVHFLMLTQALGYELDAKGRVCGVRVARTVLGAPDGSGRRRPEVVPSSESVLEVGMVLEALGQSISKGLERLLPGVELTPERLVRIDAGGGTSRQGVYAGGDLVNGGATVAQAVADGMRAADAIDAYLKGT